MVRDKRTRAWKNRYFTLKGKTLHQHHRDQKVSTPTAAANPLGRSYSLRGYHLSSSSSSRHCNTQRCVYLYFSLSLCTHTHTHTHTDTH